METKQNNQEFNNIFQKEYWLNNHKRKEERKQKFERLQEKTDNYINRVVMYFCMGLILSSLFSCKKTFNDDPTPRPKQEQRELVSVQLGLTTQIKDNPMTKSFDPSVWVYNYSDVPYVLTFSNQYNTYTESVSVDDLRRGLVVMTMFAGKYDVSYNPVHNPLYSDKIDVSINMNDVNVNGSPINLTGVVEDGLIIVDIPKNLLLPYPNGIMDNRGTTYPTLNYDSVNDFYYGYTNVRPVYPLTIYYQENIFGSVDIPNFQKGRVYWMSKEQNGTVNLTFPSLEVERITL